MKRALICTVVLIMASSMALAANKDGQVDSSERQGSITDGDAVFTFASLGSGNAVLVDFQADGATDNVYQAWYYLRTSGAAAELNLPFPADTEDFTGNTATFTWEDVDDTVDVNLFVTLVDGVDPGAASTHWELTITNVSGSPQDLELFKYVDIDADGSAGTDSATLLAANTHIQVTDGLTTVEFLGLDPVASAYKVTTFSGLRGELSDAGATTLDNTGLPFGPGDFTGAFQWTLIGVQNDGSVVVQSVISINEEAVPVQLKSFEIE